MDPLDFLTEDQMVQFLHRNKNTISCMKKPQIFLRQLRDHDLVPEKHYKKVINMKNEERKDGVYDILDWVEEKQGQCMKQFWSCVFQNHILQKYPVLRMLRKRLLDDSFRDRENFPNAEKTKRRKVPEREVKKQEQKKSTTKRKKSAKETDEEETGPSSLSSKKKKPAMKRTSTVSPLSKSGTLPVTRGKKKGTLYPNKLAKAPLSKSGTLPVTCGKKKGTLYPNKLAKGEECIRYQDCWFTPNDFQTISGKGNWKNWKLTILWQNTPLQTLLKDGRLSCPHYYRFRGQKRKTFSSSHEKSSRPSESSEDESSEDIEEVTRQQEEEEEDIERVDLSKFDAPALPVSCGSVSGVLYKSRFAGSRSKSIRTEERWFNPEEFVMQELTLTDGHWKKDILCHGKTLNDLVKKKILHVHALSCRCPVCCPKDNWEQRNDDLCYICNTDYKLVCCDECPRAFHFDCHLPTLHEDTLGDEWLCTFCVLKSNQRLWVHMSREDALSSPVPGNILRCEYLLLRLFKADTEWVFTDDPTETVPRYSDKIAKPMWLKKVKDQLQKDKYRTVGQFVCDIELIFNNCKTFNKDNTYGRMGAKMKKMFEEDFKTVYKIQ